MKKKCVPQCTNCHRVKTGGMWFYDHGLLGQKRNYSHVFCPKCSLMFFGEKSIHRGFAARA